MGGHRFLITIRKAIVWTSLVVLAVIFVPDAQGGVTSMTKDNEVGLTLTKNAPPVEDRSKVMAAADFLVGLVPSEKLNCVKDVLGKTLLARSSGAGADAVWKSNSSVKAYNQLRLSKSPCLAVLTDRYYKDLNKLKSQDRGAADRLPNERPALNARLGQGSFADQKPGFALTSALAIAQGNRALAMAMIGHCGHDDIENTLPTVIDFAKSPESASVVSAYLKSVKAGRKDRSLALDRIISEVENKGRTGLAVQCPRASSAFYAPGALGADVDISADTKKQIASLQAPTKGPGALPGKGYHTSFAAVMGCRLGACGLSEDTSARVLSTIANRYRLSRQGATISGYDNVRNLIEAQFGINWHDTQGLAREEKAISAWLSSEAGRQAVIAGGGEEFFAENRAPLSWETWKRNIDASVLARSGKAGEVWNAPPISAGRDPYFQDGTGGPRPQQSFCPGWPEERCAKARERRDTWNTDVDWTEAQQRAGGQFGAKLCAGQASTDDAIEAQACQALQRLNSGTPANSDPSSPSDGIQ